MSARPRRVLVVLPMTYEIAALSVEPPKKYAVLPLENAMLSPEALNTKPHWPMVRPEMLAPPAYVTEDGMTELVRMSNVMPLRIAPPPTATVGADTWLAATLPVRLTLLKLVVWSEIAPAIA